MTEIAIISYYFNVCIAKNTVRKLKASTKPLRGTKFILDFKKEEWGKDFVRENSTYL